MSYLKPLFQSEAKCETINMKRIFNFDVNLTHFHIKDLHLASLRRTEVLELETAYLIDGTRAYFPASFARSHQSLLTISRPFISFTSLRVPEKMKYIRIDESEKKKAYKKT